MLCVGSMPWVSKAVRTSGRERISFSSRFSRSTTAGGVPLGAITPYHISTSISPSFRSFSGGTAGSSGLGLSLLMASAFRLPFSTCCSATWMGRNIRSIWPPSRSVTAGPVPR